MKFNKLTESEIKLLSDNSKTNIQLSEILNCGVVTISRWRIKLNINIQRGRKSVKNGGTYITNGIYLACPVCGDRVYYQPHEMGDEKCCSRKCLFEYDVYRQKLVDNVGDRIYNSGKSKDGVELYIKYKNRVHRLSNIVYEQHKESINPENHPRTLCGVHGGWQLDHIKTVRECFDDGVSENDASQLKNLRMLPWKLNLRRNKLYDNL